MEKLSSTSWEVIRLKSGEKYMFEDWASSRAMFVVDGEVGTVAGYRKGATVKCGEMTLIHAMRERTVMAWEKSLVIVCRFEDKLGVCDEKLAGDTVEALRDAPPLYYGRDITRILGHVQIFMDKMLMNNMNALGEKLDGALKTLLIDKLSGLAVGRSYTEANVAAMETPKQKFFGGGSCPVSCSLSCDSCDRSPITPAV